MKFILKFFKKLLIVLAAIILAAVILLYITGNQYVFRGVQLTYLKGNTTANIDDRLDFDTRKIENGTVQEWELSEDYNKTPLTDTLLKELEAYKSAGFLIIKD
ncbi:MAG: hypothetical protein ACI95T_001590, partial [Flavobacteriales bacterium]